jgi:hypothetical protein
MVDSDGMRMQESTIFPRGTDTMATVASYRIVAVGAKLIALVRGRK